MNLLSIDKVLDVAMKNSKSDSRPIEKQDQVYIAALCKKAGENPENIKPGAPIYIGRTNSDKQMNIVLSRLRHGLMILTGEEDIHFVAKLPVGDKGIGVCTIIHYELNMNMHDGSFFPYNNPIGEVIQKLQKLGQDCSKKQWPGRKKVCRRP